MPWHDGFNARISVARIRSCNMTVVHDTMQLIKRLSLPANVLAANWLRLRDAVPGPCPLCGLARPPHKTRSPLCTDQHMGAQAGIQQHGLAAFSRWGALLRGMCKQPQPTQHPHNAEMAALATHEDPGPATSVVRSAHVPSNYHGLKPAVQAPRGGHLCGACHNLVMGLHDEPSQRCPRCALRLSVNASCPDCAARTPAFAYTIAAFDYVAPFDTLILQVKQGRRYGRTVMLGRLLADAVLRDARGLPSDTVLVPVPASNAAIQLRGFNPAGEIARSVAQRLRLPVVRGALTLADDGLGWQHGLSRQQRLQRDYQRFVLRSDATGKIANRTVAVVDDVMTTGSTLHAATLALQQGGAATVVALVVARTPALHYR